MEELTKQLEYLAGLVWGPPMLILLFGTHVYLTLRLGFIQRYTGKAIKISLEKETEGEGDVSQFAALATALAATIGTGNIVGVATAVASGGPGAVFWIWLTGVFGIATKYAEGVLSVKYRVKAADGTMAGGPMYVLEHGLKQRWLGLLFAAFTALSAFGIGNMVQANSLATLAHDTFNVPTWASGALMTVLTALVILGGIRSIAAVCEKLVPFMALFNVVGCLVILAMNVTEIPATIWLIVSTAFTGQAAIGGFIGAGVREAMRFGVARGLFSNEAGMGSAAIVAAAATTPNSVRQGLVSSSGVFWDTVVMCALTGLVVVQSGEWMKGLGGAQLTSAAFNAIPVVGPIVLTVGLLTFVVATIFGWAYYGEKACEYLFGPRSVVVYRVLWVIAVMVGSVAPLPAVWAASDITNALMAIPNLISLLLLTHVVVAETRTYLWNEDRSGR